MDAVAWHIARRLVASSEHASEPAEPEEDAICVDVSYEHRVDNPDQWNWCLVPDGGVDAVFFAGIAILVMCLASPRWDALIVLFFGGVYELLAYYWNLDHVSNAVALWLGMRPADIFVYVFLPPFLLDLSVRIDFFMLKKVAFNIAFMAFVMVAISALVLIPFMLYALDLEANGWTAAYVALFGSMIASTDAASVSAVLASGGGPEILSVILEGESLFNDASSLTLFEIFKELVAHNENTTLGKDILHIVEKTAWSAFTGICIGVGFGIVTKWIFSWLHHRNMGAHAEVAWSVGGAYLSFYITQVWCKGSGCVGSVAYGLFGSATLKWGMSTKARLSGIFEKFWVVLTYIINGLIFFYVGASCVNFTIRSTDQIFNSSGGIEIVKILLWKLPLVYLASFALRFILLFVSFKVREMLHLGLKFSWQEIVFITVAGLRGSLSLVLAQSVATMASSSDQERQVKAEIAIYTAGFVIMTLLINAPLCGPLLTWLGLDKVRQEQLAMRGQVKRLFTKFTSTALSDLSAAQEEDELLQGLDWAVLRDHTNFAAQLDKVLPEEQPHVMWYSWFVTWWHWLAAIWEWPLHKYRRYKYRHHSSSGMIDDVGMAAGGWPLDPAAVAAANKQRQQQEKADLKRTTAWKFKDMAANLAKESKFAPVLQPVLSQTSSRPLVIKDSTGSNLSTAASGAVSGRLGRGRGGGNMGRKNSRLLASDGYAANSLRHSHDNSHSFGAITPGMPVKQRDVDFRERLMTKKTKREHNHGGDSHGGDGGGKLPARVSGTGSDGSDHVDRSSRPQRGGGLAAQRSVVTPSLWGKLVSGRWAAGMAPAAAVGKANGTVRPQSAASAPLGSLPSATGNDVYDNDLGAAQSAPPGAVAPPVTAIELAEVQADAVLEVAPPPGPWEPPALMQSPFASPANNLMPAGPSESDAATTVVPPVVHSHARPRRNVSTPQLTSSGQVDTSAGPATADSPSAASTASIAPLGSQQAGSGSAPGSMRRSGKAGGARSRFGRQGGDGLIEAAIAGVDDDDDEPLPAGERRSGRKGGADAGAGTSAMHKVSSSPSMSAGQVGGLSGLGGSLARQSRSMSEQQLSQQQAQAQQQQQAQLPLPTMSGPLSPVAAPAAVPSSDADVAVSSAVGQGQAPGTPNEGLLAVPQLVVPSAAPQGSGGLASPQESEILASLLVIRPGAAGRAAGLHAIQDTGVRIVQRLGWDHHHQHHSSTGASGPSFGGKRGSMDGANRTASHRVSVRSVTLGRSSARAGGGQISGVSGVEGSELSSTSRQVQGTSARPSIGGPSIGGPSIGGPSIGGLTGGGSMPRLGASSTHVQGSSPTSDWPLHHPPGWEPPSVGPYEFALPEDMPVTAPGAALASQNPPDAAGKPGQMLPMQPSYGGGLGRASGHVRGASMGGPELGQPSVRPGGDLNRPSVRTGGDLGRSSVKVARGALGVTSMHHLARIYDQPDTPPPGPPQLMQSPAMFRITSGVAPPEMRGVGSMRPQSLSQQQNFMTARTASSGRLSANHLVGPLPGDERYESSGGGGSDSDVESAEQRGTCTPLLVEYRLRLLQGLKQFYRQKHDMGVLSDKSYKVLSYIADQSAHGPDKPLRLWKLARRELGGGPLMQWEAAAHLKLKAWLSVGRGHRSGLVRFLAPALKPFVWLLSRHLSAVSLAGLETAVELYCSLSPGHSLQTEWLQYTGVYGELLLAEVHTQAEGAWSYIIERRIEAPDKFIAVQSHRAAIDLLTQQAAFIREMHEGGMIEEAEHTRIIDLVERRLEKLARRGPTWRQPTVGEILAGTPLLRGAPPKIIEWIRTNSLMKQYQQGAVIWSLGDPTCIGQGGLMVVLRGVVRMMVETTNGRLVPYYLGAGGVGGLVSCVLEEYVPGMSSSAAYAEGNAMGKGPIVLHIPAQLLQVVRRFSREECLAPYQTLELQLYRTTAAYVLDLLRQQVTAQLSLFVRTALLIMMTSNKIDGMAMRRQRMRALVSSVLSHAPNHALDLDHLEAGIDWISELLSLDHEAAKRLLLPPAGAYDRHLANLGGSTYGGGASGYPGAGGGSLHGGSTYMAAGAVGSIFSAAGPPGVTEHWHEAMYRTIGGVAQTVVDMIRVAIKEAALVLLSPGHRVTQRSTMVLIQGSLLAPQLPNLSTTSRKMVRAADDALARSSLVQQAQPGSGPSAAAANGSAYDSANSAPPAPQQQAAAAKPPGAFVASGNEQHRAPSVLVWVSDFFEGSLMEQPVQEIVAGERGATLLVWGVEPEELLSTV